jgi:hypothetical protein
MKISTLWLLVATALLSSSPSAARQYVESDGQFTGHLSGTVSLLGSAPAPLQLLITKDLEVCGEGYRERVEVNTTDSGSLRNVVVFIEQVASGKSWTDAESGDFVNQETCRFLPHVQVIRRNTEIEIINSDSTLHNIHAYELIGRARRSLFNISQPDLGPITQELNPRRGNMVSLECDSHDFMQGWIFVTDHPYATVVDESGSFEMKNIPPGSYSVSAWHPRLGMLSHDTVVVSGSTSELNFEYAIE